MIEIPYGYCHCGCGKKTAIAKDTNKKRGAVKGEPLRFLPGHTSRSRMPDNFWLKVAITANPDKCWEWQKGKRGKYGGCSFNKREQMAHRVAWQLTYGEIPKGMCVCHKCDNPICCNPKHLFLGTHQDNMRDMNEKGRHKWHSMKGEVHPKHKLTNEDVQYIRARYATGDTTFKELAKQMGISVSNISYIVRRETWRHVA